MKSLARRAAVLLLAGLLLASGTPHVFADTDLDVGDIAIIANTGGTTAMVREGAGYEYTVLAQAGEGDVVNVLDGPIAGGDGGLWYRVEVAGTVGFIFSGLLVRRENAPRQPVRGGQPVLAGVAAQRPVNTGSGYAATISGTNGAGVRLRDGASTEAAIILVVPEGATVQVLGDPRAGGGHSWYPIAYGGTTGYVSGAYLGGGGGSVQATTQAKKVPGFKVGAHVEVTGTGGADLRIRKAASFDGAVLGYARIGTVLEILDGPERDGAGNGWYEVDYDGLTGYANAGYLAWTNAGLSERRAASAAAPKAETTAPQAAPKAEAPAPAAGGNGQALVSVAMKYVGSPYVWAGASPSGFDCSGFTMFVAQKALGKSISHALGTQVGLGTAVGSKELQPGDLVFFQNTYQPGLSHVGIYIGGGQMVHAGSERTGVVVSNIWDSYWGPKYYAARRL